MVDWKKQLILKEIMCLFISIFGSYIYYKLNFPFNAGLIFALLLWEISILVLSKNGINGRVLLRYSIYYLLILIFIKCFGFFFKKEINKVISSTVISLLNIIGIYILKYLFIFFKNINNQNVMYNQFVYKVPFKTKLRIEFIKSHLLFLRILRNINRCLSYLKSLLIVVIAWIVFLMFMAYIDMKEISYLNMIVCELYKNASSIFTSIILVAFTTLYKENNNYKQILEKQYYVYYEMLYISDNLICKICDLNLQESIFIYEINKEKIISFLKNSENANFKLRKIDFSNLINNLNDLKILIQKKEIIYWKENYNIMLNNIDEIFKIIKNDVIEVNSMIFLINNMYELLEYTRKPWRRDFKENQKIRKLIKENNNIILSYPDYIFVQEG